MGKKLTRIEKLIEGLQREIDVRQFAINVLRNQEQPSTIVTVVQHVRLPQRVSDHDTAPHQPAAQEAASGRNANG